jgi:hypothetical protein
VNYFLLTILFHPLFNINSSSAGHTLIWSLHMFLIINLIFSMSKKSFVYFTFKQTFLVQMTKEAQISWGKKGNLLLYICKKKFCIFIIICNPNQKGKFNLLIKIVFYITIHFLLMKNKIQFHQKISTCQLHSWKYSKNVTSGFLHCFVVVYLRGESFFAHQNALT